MLPGSAAAFRINAVCSLPRHQSLVEHSCRLAGCGTSRGDVWGHVVLQTYCPAMLERQDACNIWMSAAAAAKSMPVTGNGVMIDPVLRGDVQKSRKLLSACCLVLLTYYDRQAQCIAFWPGSGPVYPGADSRALL
jgi:hypothetical protein